jgi:hypothetical protein
MGAQHSSGYDPKNPSHFYIDDKTKLYKLLMGKALDLPLDTLIKFIKKYSNPQSFSKTIQKEGLNSQTISKLQFLAQRKGELLEVIGALSKLPRDAKIFSNHRGVSESFARLAKDWNVYSLSREQLGSKASELLVLASKKKYDAATTLIAGRQMHKEADRPDLVKELHTAWELLHSSDSDKLSPKIKNLLAEAAALEAQAGEYINPAKIFQYIKRPESTKLLSVFSSDFHNWQNEMLATARNLQNQITRKEEEIKRIEKIISKIPERLLKSRPNMHGAETDPWIRKNRELIQFFHEGKHIEHIQKLKREHQELISTHERVTSRVQERLDTLSREFETPKVKASITKAIFRPNQTIGMKGGGTFGLQTMRIKDLPLYTIVEAINDLSSRNFERDILGKAKRDSSGRFTLSKSGLTASARDLNALKNFSRTSEYRSMLQTFNQEYDNENFHSGYEPHDSLPKRKQTSPRDPRYSSGVPGGGHDTYARGTKLSKTYFKRDPATRRYLRDSLGKKIPMWEDTDLGRINVRGEVEKQGGDYQNPREYSRAHKGKGAGSYSESYRDRLADEDWERRRIARLPSTLRDPSKRARYGITHQVTDQRYLNFGFNPSTKKFKTIGDIFRGVPSSTDDSSSMNYARHAVYKKGIGWVRQGMAAPWNMWGHLYDTISRARSPEEIDHAYKLINYHFIEKRRVPEEEGAELIRPQIVELLKFAHQRMVILKDPGKNLVFDNSGIYSINNRRDEDGSEWLHIDAPESVYKEGWSQEAYSAFQQSLQRNSMVKQFDEDTYASMEDDFWKRWKETSGTGNSRTRKGIRYPGDPRFAVTGTFNEPRDIRQGREEAMERRSYNDWKAQRAQTSEIDPNGDGADVYTVQGDTNVKVGRSPGIIEHERKKTQLERDYHFEDPLIRFRSGPGWFSAGKEDNG